jgi:hypothetical protein
MAVSLHFGGSLMIARGSMARWFPSSKTCGSKFILSQRLFVAERPGAAGLDERTALVWIMRL